MSTCPHWKEQRRKSHTPCHKPAMCMQWGKLNKIHSPCLVASPGAVRVNLQCGRAATACIRAHRFVPPFPPPLPSNPSPPLCPASSSETRDEITHSDSPVPHIASHSSPQLIELTRNCGRDSPGQVSCEQRRRKINSIMLQKPTYY